MFTSVSGQWTTHKMIWKSGSIPVQSHSMGLEPLDLDET